MKNLTKIFRLGGVLLGEKLTAVDDVNLDITGEGKIFVLAGESGCGKSTLAKIILGIHMPTSGEVFYKGVNIFKKGFYKKKEFKREVQPVFQNPYENFNPLVRVDVFLQETVRNLCRENNPDVIREKLNLVGLNYDEVRGKYPHEFSGGELQRIAIARALLTNPKLLIADEPVSMLDASLRMTILNIFMDLKKMKTSTIYITHDLATAYYIGDELAIMFRGNIVERGRVEEVLSRPLHPYTKLLIEAVPKADPKQKIRKEIKLRKLEVKEFQAPGCKFASRCPDALPRCLKERPKEFNINGRVVRCWLFER